MSSVIQGGLSVSSRLGFLGLEIVTVVFNTDVLVGLVTGVFITADLVGLVMGVLITEDLVGLVTVRFRLVGLKGFLALRLGRVCPLLLL